MDAVLDDVRGLVRRTLLERANGALHAGSPAAAAQHLEALARNLGAEAAAEPDGEAKARRLRASEHFARQAEACRAGRAPRAASASEATGEEALPPDDRWLRAERPTTTLDDLVGLEHAKEQIRQRVLNPFQHPELARKWGVRPGGGVLLYGPPGTGKTMMARAIAGSLGIPLFVVKGGDLLSKWHSESEANLADLFRQARAARGAMVFVDEFQWLAPRQDESDASGVGRRVLCQLLQELQGFDETPESPVLFVAATNYPWDLDPTAIRRGRFGEYVHVPPPEAPAREELFRRALKRRPSQDVDCARLARLAEGFTPADIVTLVESAACAGFDREARGLGARPIGQQDLEQGIATARPSAPPELVRRCEEWARGSRAGEV